MSLRRHAVHLAGMTDQTASALPTDLPPVGSLYLGPDGAAYRLCSYRPDWRAEPFTGEQTVPSYAVLLPNGMSTNADSLPRGTTLIWKPAPGQVIRR